MVGIGICVVGIGSVVVVVVVIDVGGMEVDEETTRDGAGDETWNWIWEREVGSRIMRGVIEIREEEMKRAQMGEDARESGNRKATSKRGERCVGGGERERGISSCVDYKGRGANLRISLFKLRRMDRWGLFVLQGHNMEGYE